MSDDVFDGDVEYRLRRAAARVRTAALDAQARDWVAERADRVGFGRLAQAHYEITQAARRFGPAPPDSWIRQAVALVSGAAVTLTILLTAGRPATLPTLLGAIVLGPLVTQAVVSAVGRVRLGRAQRAPDGPAAIDDPYFYADLTRRLEACAAAARADRSDQRRAAAGEIGSALDWLRGAQGEQSAGLGQ